MIAEVLPITQLSAELYQTDQMKNAVANIYAHILLFLKQAVKWYTVGPAGRALTALFKPFELSYKETVEQIRLCARTIDSIASISSKAEVREINNFLQEESQRLMRRDKKLYEMQSRFEVAQADLTIAVGKILQILSCEFTYLPRTPSPSDMQTRPGNSTKINDIHLDMRDIKPRITDMHYHDMLSVLKPRHCPEATLERHRSIIRRQSNPRKIRARQTNPANIRILQTIGNWISSPSCSSLILNVRPGAQSRVKKLATEVVGLLKPQGHRVIWYLSPSTSGGISEGGVRCTTTEVLRTLVFQSMKLSPDLVGSSPDTLTVAKLSASHEEHEWEDLLLWVLRRLTGCFIVVEAEDVVRGERDEASNMESGRFVGVFQRLARRFDQEGMGGVKLLFVSYDGVWGSADGSGDQHGCEKVVDVWREPPIVKRPGQASSRINGRYRGPGLPGRSMVSGW